MTVLTLARRRRPTLPLGLRIAAGRAAFAGFVLAAALYAGRMAGEHSPYIHYLIALLALVTLGLLAVTEPKAAVVVTLAYLPFLALTRRLLIVYGGWQSKDPLLLVAPAVAALLYFHNRSGRRGGRVSTMVGVLLAIAVLESVNPLGGSVRAGVVGLLFVVGPLLWFFVGREVGDRRLVAVVLGAAVAVAVIVSLYGLAQSQSGFPSWDAAWIASTGFGSLQVGNEVRAFSTFSSPAEYAAFLGAGVVVCIVAALHGRVYTLALVPLLGTALFLEGSRGIFVLTVAASIAAIGLRTRRITASVLTVAIVCGLLVAGWHRLDGWAATQGQQSGNAIVQHQIGGISHPLSTRQSTLLTHWSMFVNGITGVVHHPLGLGTGATNLAGARFGGTQAQTEVDISNMFVAFGVVGGVLFAGLVLTALWQGFAVYRARGDVVALAALGVLLVGIGQWLNGGYYALAPLLWLLVGWTERASLELAEET